MKRDDIHQKLAHIAERELPADLHMWLGVRAKIPAQHVFTAQQWLPTITTIRMVWIAALVVLLLLSVTNTYALAALVLRVRRLAPSLDSDYMAAHAQPLALTEVLDGTSMTLHWVYVDTERIAIGYQIAGATNVNVSDAALTSDEGSVFRLAMMIAGDERLMIFTREQPTVHADETSSYQLSVLVTGAATRTTFDFSAASVPQQMIMPMLTSESAGVAITLQQVEVFATEIQAVLCFNAPVPFQAWEGTATLEIGAKMLRLQTTDALPDQPPCYTYTFAIDELPAYGQWTLRVTDVVKVTMREHIQGKWTFRFFMESTPTS